MFFVIRVKPGGVLTLDFEILFDCAYGNFDCVFTEGNVESFVDFFNLLQSFIAFTFEKHAGCLNYTNIH